MLYLAIAFVLTQLGMLLLMREVFREMAHERRTLTAAALEAQGKQAAAARAAAPPPAPHHEVKAEVDRVRRELEANGGVFGAANPFGRPGKPLGV